MKKQDQSPRRSKKPTAKDTTTAQLVTKSSQQSKSKNLSLIFSKLAEFEDQRSDDDFFLLLGDDNGDFSIPTVNLSEELGKLTAIFENNMNAAEKLSKLKAIFQEKLNLMKDIDTSMLPALSSCRTTYKKKDLMIMDNLRLKQDIHFSESSYKEKAELCRNLQARNKEYEATSQLLLIEEAKKTEELRVKCLDSIVSITKQIEEEEAAVASKKEENDSLAVKITEFNSHLVIRDEHLTTQRKARAIEQQLLEAKKTQYLRAEEQRSLNSKSYQNHILQLKEAEKDLVRQVGLYVEKASSFEATLDDTKAVFQQFEDRADAIMKEVDEVDEEILKQNITKNGKKEKLLKMQVYIIASKKKIGEMKDDHTLTDKCRSLQARRTELTKVIALFDPPLEDSDIPVEGVTADVADIVEEDDRPSEEVIDVRSGRTSPHQDSSWPPVLSSSSSRSSSTPPSSSSRNWTDSASKENTAGEDTPISSPSIHSPKRLDSVL